MTGHRYWGLHLTGAAANAYSFAELRMFTAASPDTTVAIDGTNGTAGATQTLSGTTVAQGFDGNTSTFWGSQDKTGTQYVWFDFGSGNAPEITSIAIVARNDSNYTQTPNAFTVVSSDDGTTWNDELAVTATWTSAGQVQTFFGWIPDAHQNFPELYVEALANGGDNASAVEVPEVWLEVYSKVPPTTKVQAAEMYVEVMFGVTQDTNVESAYEVWAEVLRSRRVRRTLIASIMETNEK